MTLDDLTDGLRKNLTERRAGQVKRETRYDYAAAVAMRYQRSGREQKGWILDEFCAATGYNRKYAIKLLRGPFLALRCHRATASNRLSFSAGASFAPGVASAWSDHAISPATPSASRLVARTLSLWHFAGGNRRAARWPRPGARSPSVSLLDSRWGSASVDADAAVRCLAPWSSGTITCLRTGSRLIGREQDLLVLRHALLGTEGRLLTLTGTGGCGKTRLALELAADVLSHFPDGVWLVELAAVADPALVPQAIVSALGIRERPGEPLTATLIGALSKREFLLVLDNCEHVIEVCARVVEELLDTLPAAACAGHESRGAANSWRDDLACAITGACPTRARQSTTLLRSPAVQLFVERAQAAVPSFTVDARAAVVGRICSRLDGLPLAIELAAARVRTLGVEQILERLDDSIQPPGRRQPHGAHVASRRCVRRWTGATACSASDERAVFRRLAVFAESCSLDAAEAVCARR